MTYSETEKAEAGLQLAEEIMDAFEHDGWPGIDYIIDMIAKYEALTVSAMPKILAALGWSGGTVEQVVAEVAEMRRKIRNVYVYLESVPLQHPFEAHFQAIHDIIRPIGHPVPQPIGQGVAALLPEHGEAKP